MSLGINEIRTKTYKKKMTMDKTTTMTEEMTTDQPMDTTTTTMDQQMTMKNAGSKTWTRTTIATDNAKCKMKITSCMKMNKI